jgi:hypothetical protein
LSEYSCPFRSSGTGSRGGGEVARRGWCGVATLAALPTWLADMTGLHGPTASRAMSTRKRDPGLEVPDPMDARSMAIDIDNSYFDNDRDLEVVFTLYLLVTPRA